MRKLFFLCFLSWHFLLQSTLSQINTFYPDELVVTASSLHLRQSPSMNSSSLALLKKGEFMQYMEPANKGEYVEIDSTWGVWLKVRGQGKMGYVFSPYVSGAYTLQYEGQFTSELSRRYIPYQISGGSSEVNCPSYCSV
jgi:uncharacterized protein YgiM (DUF1202 family)